ncbi:GntP family permease [Herbiconiux ginsengi]|uniref:Gluconate:H+ symporter, GntP family n=1 Tax=Herbiconiux ginsengi TaxID=381665 RepID=A0A1H3U341_9MICO|nr:gluconate:H+ symporter [Herbiconiux ginsengi]SDZ56717.1 gluconate:H+ symporter, GntP family [Herbiconiux ginsengi]
MLLSLTPLSVLAVDEAPAPEPAWLITVLLVGIAWVVVAVTVLKLHPILSLLTGGLIVGLLAGLGITDTVTSLTAGVAKNLGGTGLLIVLGAMFGAILSESGAASQIVTRLTSRVGKRGLPWVMLAASVIVGLPMFFEVGFVTLIPIAIVLAKKANIQFKWIVFPLLAGLDAAQCLLPPHPGPIAAADSLGADIGLTLLIGLGVAIPAIIITGPVLGRIMAPRVEVTPPKAIADLYTNSDYTAPRPPGTIRSFIAILTPVVLILGKAIIDIAWPNGSGIFFNIVEFVGTPVIALLLAVICAMVVLGTLSGSPRQILNRWVGGSLGPIAGVVFIVGAAGGFSTVIVDSGSAQSVLDIASGAGVPILLLAFGMAALLVAALGSSTVAGLTAASLVAPSAVGLDPIHLVLLTLAAGAGSSFLVHVNSGGFWLSKEYFGLTVGQNLRVWTLTHTVLSVVAILVIGALWVIL